MGYDMEMDDFHDEEEFNRKELERLKKEILEEAKKVVNNYVENPSDISGSVVNIHQNSPFRFIPGIHIRTSSQVLFNGFDVSLFCSLK